MEETWRVIVESVNNARQKSLRGAPNNRRSSASRHGWSLIPPEASQRTREYELCEQVQAKF